MPADLQVLLEDLDDETEAFGSLVRPLVPEEYELATPAVGWSIRDQVSHLAYFDEALVLAATSRPRFRVHAAAAMTRAADFADEIAKDHRGVDAEDLLGWFQQARAELVARFRRLDARQRIPWYGLSMSAASAVTVRLMETWAHGQDVADALAVERMPHARLRHIVELGVRTREFSFRINDLPVPSESVRVSLDAPGGKRWTWCPNGVESVEGPIEDFSLVVTQRRHVDETSLIVRGAGARQWMSVAQAFAGPPTGVRDPEAGEPLT